MERVRRDRESKALVSQIKNQQRDSSLTSTYPSSVQDCKRSRLHRLSTDQPWTALWRISTCSDMPADTPCQLSASSLAQSGMQSLEVASRIRSPCCQARRLVTARSKSWWGTRNRVADSILGSNIASPPLDKGGGFWERTARKVHSA